MNLTELATLVSKETGEPAYKVLRIISSTFKIIRNKILIGEIVKIKGIVTMYIDVVDKLRFYNVAKKNIDSKPRRFVLKIFPSIILKKQIDAKKTY